MQIAILGIDLVDMSVLAGHFGRRLRHLLGWEAVADPEPESTNTVVPVEARRRERSAKLL